MKPTLSIIVPALNEAASIQHMLQQTLASVRTLELQAELIVVDGGSDDDTLKLSQALADRVIESARGRASQMNAGAAIAKGKYLLFLHADTELPPVAVGQLKRALSRSPIWGRFDVCISGEHVMLLVIAFMMNVRSKVTGIATGDQAMFVRRDVFEAVGGFVEQPLMEDIELSKQLLKQARPVCLKGPVQTSGRRWESHGVWRTIALMWRLRWRYWRGQSAEQLAREYRS